MTYWSIVVKLFPHKSGSAPSAQATLQKGVSAAMSFYGEHIYPHLVNGLGDPRPIREIRAQLMPLAHGTVLEIGVGPGANFVHYDATKVTKLLALEPNRGMIRLAEKRRRDTSLKVDFLDLLGERIPLDDHSVDTVVSTFTLCTIPKVTAAIQGLRRMLRPDGRLIFLEHGLAPDPAVQRWQRWSEPIPHYVFEGCHVTRDIPCLITAGGFRIERIETAYLAPFPKSWSYCFWEAASP